MQDNPIGQAVVDKKKTRIRFSLQKECIYIRFTTKKECKFEFKNYSY